MRQALRATARFAAKGGAAVADMAPDRGHLWSSRAARWGLPKATVEGFTGETWVGNELNHTYEVGSIEVTHTTARCQIIGHEACEVR